MIGVSEGDAVALLARNHRGFVLAMSAVAKAGADVLLLNAGFSANQIAGCAAASSRRRSSTTPSSPNWCPTLPPTAGRSSRDGASTDLEPEPTTLAALAAAYPNSSPPRPRPHQQDHHPHLRHHRNSERCCARSNLGRQLNPDAGGPGSAARPHPAQDRDAGGSGRTGLPPGVCQICFSGSLGCTFVCVRKFDPEQWLAAIAEHDVQALAVVPVMLQRMELPGDVRQRYDTSSLTVVAASGSAPPGDLSDRWMNEFGDNLYNLYGSTEVANATIATPEDMRRAPGTAGQTDPRHHGEAVGREQLRGPAGEGGPYLRRQLPAVRRLFRRRRQTAPQRPDGDRRRGPFRRRGQMFVVGRDDDMIVSGGENVFPRRSRTPSPGIRRSPMSRPSVSTTEVRATSAGVRRPARRPADHRG